jgi:hypothetical protein
MMLPPPRRATAPGEVGECVLGAEPGAFEIHSHHPVPIRLAGGGRRLQHVDGGVVHQHVDAAPGAGDVADPGLDPFAVGDIDPLEAAALAGQRRRIGGRLDVGEGHSAALVEEGAADR